MADEHEHGLVHPTLDVDSFDKGERQQKEDEANDEDDEQ